MKFYLIIVFLSIVNMHYCQYNNKDVKRLWKIDEELSFDYEIEIDTLYLTEGYNLHTVYVDLMLKNTHSTTVGIYIWNIQDSTTVIDESSKRTSSQSAPIITYTKNYIIQVGRANPNEKPSIYHQEVLDYFKNNYRKY